MLYKFRPWKKIATLTASGTYTVPDGVYQILVLLVGGGGPGGSSFGTYSGRAAGGGAGGAVLYGILNVNPGQKIPYVIGQGGKPATSSSSAGGDGGYTSFAQFMAQGGGPGGNAESDNDDTSGIPSGSNFQLNSASYSANGYIGRCGTMGGAGASRKTDGETGRCNGGYGIFDGLVGSIPQQSVYYLSSVFPSLGGRYLGVDIDSSGNNIGDIPGFDIIFQLYDDLTEFFKLGSSGAGGGMLDQNEDEGDGPHAYPGGVALSGGDGGSSSSYVDNSIPATAGKDATEYGGGGGGAGTTNGRSVTIKGGNGKQGVIFVYA